MCLFCYIRIQDYPIKKDVLFDVPLFKCIINVLLIVLKCPKSVVLFPSPLKLFRNLKSDISTTTPPPVCHRYVVSIQGSHQDLNDFKDCHFESKQVRLIDFSAMQSQNCTQMQLQQLRRWFSTKNHIMRLNWCVIENQNSCQETFTLIVDKHLLLLIRVCFIQKRLHFG